MDGKLSDELRYLLRGEELSTRLPRIGSIVRYEELVGISEEVYMAILKGPASRHVSDDSSQGHYSLDES